MRISSYKVKDRSWAALCIYKMYCFVKIISIPDEELFSETSVGCTTSYFVKIMWYYRWFSTFVPPPLICGSVLLNLRSPEDGCCSISDNLSCSSISKSVKKWLQIFSTKRHIWELLKFGICLHLSGVYKTDNVFLIAIINSYMYCNILNTG